MSADSYSKVVYLTSRGGCNSGLLCYRILKEDVHNDFHVVDIHSLIRNFDFTAHKNKIILTYGPYEFLKKKNFYDMNLGKILTHIFLPPYADESIHGIIEHLKSTHISIHKFDELTYTFLNGQAALKQILDIMK